MPDLEGFAMPTELAVDEKTETATYARFITEPWEKGFGHTLGNALRRVLLSSMDGVAVASIRIDNADHEFSSLPGIVEDVTEIVLNIKRLHVQCDGELPRTLELYADKAGPVTAAAVREDSVTTVLNKDLLICTLDQDTPFRMELDIDRGRGYRPAEENKREDHPIGVIPVDCLFSPVDRVRYGVHSCRVGQRTDYDCIEVEVWTDGRVTPRQAMYKAALLLREHLSIFLPEEETATVAVQITSPEDRELLAKLLTTVNDLELSVRAKNCLNTAQVRTIGELVEKTEVEMLKYRNFGKKSLQEIKVKLSDLDLSLGMTLKDEIRNALQQKLAEADDED